jgi:hypothetical protein
MAVKPLVLWTLNILVALAGGCGEGSRATCVDPDYRTRMGTENANGPKG